MNDYLRLIFPYGCVILALASASLFYGADTPLAAFFFSAVLLFLCGAGLLFTRTQALPVSAWICFVLYTVFFSAELIRGTAQIGLADYAALAAAGGLFLTGRAAMLKSDRITLIWSMMLVAFLAISVWAFIDFIIHPDTIHGSPRPYHLGRLSAAFLSANTAATFFGTGVLLASVGLIKALGRSGWRPIDLVEGLFRHGALALVTFLFCAICLVLTASRAGIAFCAICFVLLLGWQFLASRKVLGDGFSARWIVLAGLALLVILAAGVWSLSGDVAGQRFADMTASSDARQMMYAAYWQASQQHPLFGTGLGSFDMVNNAAMTADNAHILSVQGAAHNIFLQWLIQKGWLGGIAMCGTVAVILISVARAIKTRQRFRPHLRSVLVISLFVILHGQVDYALEIPGFMWWWALILGLGAGIASGGEGRAARRR